MLLFYFCFLCIITSSWSRSLPTFINKCSKSSPDLNECLNKNAVDAGRKLKDGNKDLGVVPLEPFRIEKVELGNNNASGAVHLYQVYENMDIFGMTNSTFTYSDANFTGDNCYWNYKCNSPFVRMVSDYTMKGRLLLFPINGHGKCTNYLYDIDGDYGAKCERYTKKNRTHLRITEFNFEMRPKKIVFNFENVIDGNEQLSKEVVKTLNENSEPVWADVGPAFNEIMATVWKQTINQVFSKVPEDELFLP